MKNKWLWTALLLMRAAGLMIGLDRLPMVPTVNPEVIINDPAVALSRGYGLTAFSFEHSVNGLDKLYGHFPPVFIWLQALVFTLFGFSAISLRALSVFCDLATCVVFLAVLAELFAQKIVDRTGMTVAAVLILLEPTAMAHAREARMESLNTLLGGIALLLCVRAARDAGHRMMLWTGAALAIGVALATHPAAILMWVVFAVWSVAWFRRLGLTRWIALHALPPAVMVTAWLMAWGSRAPDAIRQMRHLATFAGITTLRVAELAANVYHRSFREAQASGGLGLAFTLVAVTLAVYRLFSRRTAGTADDGEWRGTLWLLTASVVMQCLLLQFVVPTSGTNRAVMIVPFALVCGGVAVSHLSASSTRTVMAAAVVAALLQLGVTAGYLAQLRNGWKGRGPDRFDAIVSAIPAGQRVAGPPELWFAFRSHNRQFTVIYRAMGEDAYWAGPHSFDDYDAVILDPNFPLYQQWRKQAGADKPVEYMLHTYGRDFMVIAKTLNGLSPDGGK